MYAIASVSSSAYQLSRVTNEVESQIRKSPTPSPAPALTPAKYSQNQHSIAAASAVQSPMLSASNSSIASKASQVAPVKPINTHNDVASHNFSRPQQQQISQFNLAMVNQSPKNVTSSGQVTASSQNNNVAAAQKPTAASEILTESPYLIVVLNQNLTQKYETNSTKKPPDKPPQETQKI